MHIVMVDWSIVDRLASEADQLARSDDEKALAFASAMESLMDEADEALRTGHGRPVQDAIAARVDEIRATEVQ